MSTKEREMVTVELERSDAETFASTGSVATEPLAFAYEAAQQRIKSALRTALEAPPRSPGVSEGIDWRARAVAHARALASMLAAKEQVPGTFGETWQAEAKETIRLDLGTEPFAAGATALHKDGSLRAALLEEAQPSPDRYTLDEIRDWLLEGVFDGGPFNPLDGDYHGGWDDAVERLRSALEKGEFRFSDGTVAKLRQSEAQPSEGEGEPCERCGGERLTIRSLAVDAPLVPCPEVEQGVVEVEKLLSDEAVRAGSNARERSLGANPTDDFRAGLIASIAATKRSRTVSTEPQKVPPEQMTAALDAIADQQGYGDGERDRYRAENELTVEMIYGALTAPLVQELEEVRAARDEAVRNAHAQGDEAESRRRHEGELQRRLEEATKAITELVELRDWCRRASKVRDDDDPGTRAEAYKIVAGCSFWNRADRFLAASHSDSTEEVNSNHADEDAASGRRGASAVDDPDQPSQPGNHGGDGTGTDPARAGSRTPRAYVDEAASEGSGGASVAAVLSDLRQLAEGERALSVDADDDKLKLRAHARYTAYNHAAARLSEALAESAPGGDFIDQPYTGPRRAEVSRQKNRDPGAVKRIGFGLAGKRERAGMTRAELAKAGGTTVAYLEKIERGEVDPPLSLVLKLGSSMGWIIR